MSGDLFSALMGAVNPALVIVTTVADGVRAGCLVGFHGQSSIAPQRYCVWLSKANHTYRVGLTATHFAVHFVTRADLELAERFGTRSGEQTDKFAGVPTESGPAGVPLLADLPHRIAGRRLAMWDLGGDHVGVELSVELVGASDASGATGDTGAFDALRVSDAAHLRPGHPAEERAISPS